MTGVHDRIDDPRGQQRSLRRIGSDASLEEGLYIAAQITEVCEGTFILQIELDSIDLSIFATRSISEFLHDPRQVENRTFQSICVADQEHGGIIAVLRVVGGLVFGHGQRRIGQIAWPLSTITGTPYFVPLQALDREHSRLATQTSLDHTLHRLQGVVTIGLDAAVTDGERLVEFDRILLVFEPGVPPTQWQGRAGHDGNVQLVGAIPHPLRIGEAVGKMFVVEDGDTATTLGKHPGNLLKEVSAGIHVSAAFVPRIVSVFTDQQDRIDVQLVAPGVQGTSNTRVDGHVELLGNSQTDVVFQGVIEIDGDDLDVVEHIPSLIDRRSLEELRHDHIGVRLGVVDGDNGGDTQAVGHSKKLQQRGSEEAAKIIWFPLRSNAGR